MFNRKINNRLDYLVKRVERLEGKVDIPVYNREYLRNDYVSVNTCISLILSKLGLNIKVKEAEPSRAIIE